MVYYSVNILLLIWGEEKNTPGENRTRANTLEGCHDTISPRVLYFYKLFFFIKI